MNRYTESDILAAFNTPVDSKYRVQTQERPIAPIATQSIQNLQPQNISADIASRASSHLADLSQSLPADETEGWSDEEVEDTEQTAVALMPGNEVGELAPTTWFSVADLPGNIQSQIRRLGKALFKDITTTPIADIAVMSTISNPEDQVRRIYAGVTREGTKIRDMDFDFSPIMPGYTAAGEVWRIDNPKSSASGYEFLLIKDFAGYYVYGYPVSDSKVFIRDNTPVTAYLESLVYTGFTSNASESRFKEWTNE
jgi:hypothetical protein